MTREFDKVVEFLSVDEPWISLLTGYLHGNLQKREEPIPNPHHPANQLQEIRGTHIKRLLLQLHPRFLTTVLGTTFDRWFEDSIPFRDQEKVYAGVYVGSYLHEDGTGMTCRDVLRIANVLLDKPSLLYCVAPKTLKRSTVQAAKMLGQAWKMNLVEMGLWRCVKEVDAIADDGSDSEESEIFQDEPEEAFDDDEMEEAVDVEGEGVVPLNLNFAKFSRPFFYSPLYVGYSSAPRAQWLDHQRCKSFLVR